MDRNEIEKLILAPQAAFTANSRGRQRPEEPCQLRTCYQRDRDRIIHSKAFRRLKTKTQVFINPYGDHYRTRMTHTFEVMQIARTIARALRLNEDLVEAIALGHDLGHTPFGHAGERSLAAIAGHFRHNEQSLRVVDYIEKNGEGLNLTFEVRDGILNHSGSLQPATLEGEIVQLSDRIAYVNHDIDDAIRAGLLQEAWLPQAAVACLGNSSSARINTLVISVVRYSQPLTKICMGEAEAQAMNMLRDFLFQNVYQSKEAMEQEDLLRQQLVRLFSYYMDEISLVPVLYLDLAQKESSGSEEAYKKLAVTDYIAGMSDAFAFQQIERLGLK